MKEDLKYIRTKVDEIHKTVHGNGHAGLKGRVIRAETQLKVFWVVVVASIGKLIHSLFKGG